MGLEIGFIPLSVEEGFSLFKFLRLTGISCVKINAFRGKIMVGLFFHLNLTVRTNYIIHNKIHRAAKIVVKRREMLISMLQNFFTMGNFNHYVAQKIIIRIILIILTDDYMLGSILNISHQLNNIGIPKTTWEFCAVTTLFFSTIKLRYNKINSSK